MAPLGRTTRWRGVEADAFLAVRETAVGTEAAEAAVGAEAVRAAAVGAGVAGLRGSAGGPGAGATCRPTLRLPAELVDWVRTFAEISHRTVEEVVGPLIAAEQARADAGRPPRPGQAPDARQVE
ncbi:hypothetical protein OG535_07610 [Kitasatospora sp. NBC_00085]|uniref:hypothetical protein n=1 Tax=unclassified Kitasatospora TaxID=2633591 RepID=UPI00324F8984